jgi:hypothetical protein
MSRVVGYGISTTSFQQVAVAAAAFIREICAGSCFAKDFWTSHSRQDKIDRNAVSCRDGLGKEV